MAAHTTQEQHHLPARTHARERALELACAHLEALGWRIADRRWRIGDEARGIVAVDGGQCVFCVLDDEPALFRRVRDRWLAPRVAAVAWLKAARRRRGYARIRFDRLAVHLGVGGELVGLEHEPDAY